MRKGDASLQFDEAVAAIAAALNDPKRSLIGDPRQQVYKVSLITMDMREAMQFARQLARVGVTPKTTIEHDQSGGPARAEVTIWSKGDHRALLEAVQAKLASRRQKQLEDLVLAFEPIPAELLERIARADERGMSPRQIAVKLNELGIMTGMGGKRWTCQKVKKALDQHARRQQEQEAA
jgi:hypothetical protein